jgi:hypothetical protein
VEAQEVPLGLLVGSLRSILVEERATVSSEFAGLVVAVAVVEYIDLSLCPWN